LVTTTSRKQTSDKEEYDALSERAKELGVAEAWTELGYVSHDELPSVYRSADAYVFPSFTESFGHSMVEAMASGLPVVAANTEVNREVCAGAASYFDPFDPADCAKTIRGVLENRDQRTEMTQASVRRAEEFSWEKYTKQLANVFSEIVGKSEGRTSSPHFN
jgi:glycosyltransferase involved in cell wall biosynthesis